MSPTTLHSNDLKNQPTSKNVGEHAQSSLADSVEQHPEPTQEPLVGSNSTSQKYNKRKKAEESISKLLSTLFIWEILAMILSSASLIGIVVVLRCYNHHPQPTWNNLSLNTVISWLSTIAKGCVLFSISEGLGQLKWVWFAQKRRQLSDLRAFDAASRGLTGSAGLIWNLRARHFAVPGSLAVILALAFDPFTQNLIHYYPKLVADSSQIALVSNGSEYSTVGLEWITGGDGYMEPGLKSSIYSSLFDNDSSRPWATPKWSCSTGNCTWDPIAALEVRARCSNITDQLKLSCSNITKDDPNEDPYSVFIGKNNCTYSILGTSLTASFVPDYGYAVAAATGSSNDTLLGIQLLTTEDMLNGSPTMQTHWRAMQCALVPTVHSFRPTVSRGVYREETLGTWSNRSLDGDDATSYVLRPHWGLDMGMAPNKNFSISEDSLVMMKTFARQFFSGYVQNYPRKGFIFVGVDNSQYASTDLIQAISYFNITACPTTVKGWEKLRCAAENMAAGMTKTFRDNTDGKSSAVGLAMISTTYVSVHWQWIALPVIIWLLGLITLAGTIWKTYRAEVPTWKNDAMPLLFLYENSQDEKPRPGEELPNDRKGRLYESGDRMILSE
ncbi:uncharacterized protein N7496_003586 [Penicillium cataractarum]|uniref:Uncharacterized protein n=1 Tax=Penicillium cataractarum TaxID=2100454 RepID=A0A9W9VGC2_9EURO|nr:uncharacterized protein N7496_003586 [Penicillium cataractarum]KAJ5381158.1 hypothetical protein N7496_003586 [Penicillium cataractarum]